MRDVPGGNDCGFGFGCPFPERYGIAQQCAKSALGVPGKGVCNAIPIWLPGDAKLAAKELAANPPWRRAFRT